MFLRRIVSTEAVYISPITFFRGPVKTGKTLQETLDNSKILKSSFFSFFAASAFTRTQPCMKLLCGKARSLPVKTFYSLCFYRSPHITDREIMQTVEDHSAAVSTGNGSGEIWQPGSSQLYERDLVSLWSPA